MDTHQTLSSIFWACVLFAGCALVITTCVGCVTHPDGSRGVDTDLVRIGGELAIGAGREYLDYRGQEAAAELRAEMQRQAALIESLERTIARLLASQGVYDADAAPTGEALSLRGVREQ